jgi:hypothetical protein
MDLRGAYMRRAKLIVLTLLIAPVIATAMYWMSGSNSDMHCIALLKSNKNLLLSVRDIFYKHDALLEMRKSSKGGLRVWLGNRSQVTERVVGLGEFNVLGMQQAELDSCVELMGLLNAVILSKDMITGEFQIVVGISGIVPSGEVKSIVWNPSENDIQLSVRTSTISHGVVYQPIDSFEHWYLKREWN